MGRYGRPTLRDLFDDAPTPRIAHPPHTHHRDYYLATDGSYTDTGSGIGAIIETGDGECLHRIAKHDDAPDNNVAEYRALHLGLDALAEHASPAATVGVLVDHDDLAANVNAAALGMFDTNWLIGPVRIPPESTPDWDDIRSHIAGFAELRAACLNSDQNPAHVLANTPEAYTHLTHPTPRHASSARNPDQIPPPSRANRHADD